MQRFGIVRGPSRRRARGQALIWLLGTMATAVAVLYGVFNVAQLTAGKAKVVNAADAAALAGATSEARMLNLMAYNNRAVMANEVLLVQMVSLESWLGYVSNTGIHIGEVLSLIPPLEPLAAIIMDAGNAAQTVRDDVLDPAVDVTTAFVEVLKTGLAAAHLAVSTLGGGVAVDAANSIVAANRADFGTHKDNGVQMASGAVMAMTSVRAAWDWSQFTRQYTANDRKYAKQVLEDSRDGFSANRPGNALFNIDLGLAGMEKHGGTRLHDFDRWEAQDTLEMWSKHPCKEGLCKDYLPIGWGRATVDKDGNAGEAWKNPDRPVVDLAMSEAKNHKNWSGVPELFDIRNRDKAARATLGIDFSVAVTRAQGSNMTTQNLGMQKAHLNSVTGSAEMNERLQGDQLASLARARVSFERPVAGLAKDWTAGALVRPDAAKEYGSLYSPFWQARLTDIPLGEKSGFYGLMGINPLLAPTTPGGQ